MDSDFEERTRNRILGGEVYVICSECGARLWSDDARPGERQDRVRDCPYKHDQGLAEKMGCADPNSGGAYYPIHGHF